MKLPIYVLVFGLKYINTIKQKKLVESIGDPKFHTIKIANFFQTFYNL